MRSCRERAVRVLARETLRRCSYRSRKSNDAAEISRSVQKLPNDIIRPLLCLVVDTADVLADRPEQDQLNRSYKQNDDNQRRPAARLDLDFEKVSHKGV